MKFIFEGHEFSKLVKKKRLIDDNVDMRTLAKRLNISPATISRTENGSMPEIKSYAILCHYIGKSMHDFIKIKNGK